MATSEGLSAQRDADAFAAVARAHAGMVFATCYRILGDAASAEDTAQECFLELARKAADAPERIGAWLHGVATRKALHAARTRKRRRYHEARAREVRTETHTDSTWAEIGPVVDQAIENLPADLREALVLYYLEEKTQAEIAERVGTSRQTIQRRIGDAIAALRSRLKKSGFFVGAAALTGMLATQTAHTAPAAVSAAIGKIAASGVAAQATSAAGVKGTVIGVTMKKAVAAVVLTTAVAAGGVAVHKAIGTSKSPSPVVAPPIVQKETPKSVEQPTAILDNPFIQDLMQMDKWVQAEKDAGRLGPEDATHVEVRELNMTRTRQVSFADFSEPMLKRLVEAGRYSRETGILTIGETLFEGDSAFYDVGGKDIPFRFQRTAEDRGYLHLDLAHAAMPEGVLKFIMSNQRELQSMQRHKNLWKEGEFWHLLSGNGSPNYLNYYKVILPKTAILVGASPRPIAVNEEDGRLALTIRHRNFETGYNYHVVFLWPEIDGSTFLDLPMQVQYGKSDSTTGKE